MAPVIDFWFDFASTYSYLTVMRIEPAAAAHGVGVRWRPFLLGPIFAVQGWTTSPFNIYEAKGRYMVRDIGRIATARGIAFHLPDPFPQNSLLVARTAVAIADQPRRAAFCRAVFAAEFADRLPINDPAVISVCLERAGIDPAPALAAAQTDAVKAHLRGETELARNAGLFGTPSFVTLDGEVFWGDDRLEMALAWANHSRSQPAP